MSAGGLRRFQWCNAFFCAQEGSVVKGVLHSTYHIAGILGLPRSDAGHYLRG